MSVTVYDPNDPQVHAIPGGHCRLRDPDTLTERHRRPLKVRMSMLSPSRMQQIALSAEDTIEGLTIDLALTEREAEILMGFGDAVVLALLESWTLDRPMPATADEVQDLPGPLYDALQRITAKDGARILAGAGTRTEVGEDGKTEVVDTFSVAAIEDSASPTGPSAG